MLPQACISMSLGCAEQERKHFKSCSHVDSHTHTQRTRGHTQTQNTHTHTHTQNTRTHTENTQRTHGHTQTTHTHAHTRTQNTRTHTEHTHTHRTRGHTQRDRQRDRQRDTHTHGKPAGRLISHYINPTKAHSCSIQGKDKLQSGSLSLSHTFHLHFLHCI